MKLIIGLGNPGKEYEKTHHNVGFYFIDSYAKMYGVDKWSDKKDAFVAEIRSHGEKVILVKPLSYMNLSGTVVKKYLDYYDISIEDLLIISDDLDLPVGTYRLRRKGSSGGHNGLKDIENHLNTDEYKRLKIGILNNDFISTPIDAKDYVLSKISKEDLKTYESMTSTINQIIDSFVHMSFEDLMNEYNHK